MEKFQCEKCGNMFESEGAAHEYHSPVYGPCSKKVADCPQFKSDEYRPPNQARSKSSFQRDNMPAMGGCAAGGCCCSG